MSKHRRQGLKAWLITWEWMGEHARPAKPVVAILDPRLSGARVAELVEFLYRCTSYTLLDQVNFFGRDRAAGYVAKYGEIGGVPWQGEVTCGDNPWLRARLVDNFRVEKDSSGQEHATWSERPRPRATPR